MGDKVLTISPGTHSKKMIQENEKIGSIASMRDGYYEKRKGNNGKC
jgi:hypothetical protein